MIWNAIIVTSVLVNIAALVKIYQLENEIEIVDRLNEVLSFSIYDIVREVVEENNLKTKHELIDIKEILKEE